MTAFARATSRLRRLFYSSDAEPHVVDLKRGVQGIEELDVSGGGDFVFADLVC